MRVNLLSPTALVLLASTSAAQSLAAGKHALPPVPARFVAVGDYGTTSAGSFAVAALVHALEPRFVITLGDNNYPNGAASTIDQNIGQHYHDYIHPYVGSYGSGALVNRFFPCLGNHDWVATGALPYLNYFVLPDNERYYRFRRGKIDFFALDSDPAEPDGIGAGSAQAAWLEAGLAASSAPFRIVYMHHAPYCSSAVHGSHGDLQWPFRSWGASLVLAGHDHLYERASVSGLPYVVCGLGGNARYAFATPIGGSQVRFNAGDGAVLMVADETSLRLQLIATGEVVADDYVLPSGGVDPGITTLVAEGASWKYLDTGVDPGASWTSLAFDDAPWSSGSAELGYGDGDEATTVGYGGNPLNRYVTTWFRRTFSVPDPAAFGQLQFRLVRDDGAVVYVNGVEVARSNMPGGSITASTLASSGIAGTLESTSYPFTFSPSLLSAGTNVIAVEIHQSAVNSSDISFALELVGLGAGTTLVARGSDWRYLDTGVDPGALWQAPGFDDQSWSMGPAQLGFGEGDEATTTSSGSATTWFRTSFSVTQASAVEWLECAFVRDDGLVIYLNGQEAARFDLPRSGVTAATLAPFDVAGVDENVLERTSLDPRLLVDGTNTIAVEVHQSSLASDDLSFDLELVAH
jgi:hypothetical protein